MKDAKEIFKAFEGCCNNKQCLVRLQVYFVLKAVELTANYGDFEESYYNYVEKLFDKALLNAKDNIELMRELKPTCLEILKFAEECGWGFPDALEKIYNSYYIDLDFLQN